MIKEINPWSVFKGPENPVARPVTYIKINNEKRDGCQGAQILTHPKVEKEIELLSMETTLGYIDHADIGFPASHPSHQRRIEQIVEFVDKEHLPITLSCAARGAAFSDIKPILTIANKYGVALESDIFLDPTEERASAQGWNRKEKLKQLETNIKIIKKQGLPVMVVPERATAAKPEELAEMCKIAADCGADRICITDTQGIANYKVIENIFRFVFQEFGTKYPDIKWDFHGHNDLGMGVANCLVAAHEGVDRVHATALGIGERAGNVDLVNLLIVLNLEGLRTKPDGQEDDLSRIQQYSELASKILGVPIPKNAPIVGENAFKTTSGVHANQYYHEGQLKNCEHHIYLPFDPKEVGREAGIEVGPMSGLSNVYGKSHQLGISEMTEEVALQILQYAKKHMVMISDKTFFRLAKQHPNGKK
ncbi:MAG: hypothetical protein M1450_01815 [Patescibacteria group bacterium]|nr:hypothetical protein [Patescibacteria group bacterium]